jgi:hypothetical protein
MLRNLSIILVSTLFILFVLSGNSLKIFSQAETTQSVVKNDSWISKRDNLNMTINLEPAVPIIDETTKISFEVKQLDISKPFEGLNIRVTITDHDGRLYKFENKLIPVTNGKFSVDYIFPDDGEHRIILQLYKNTTPFTVSSFDLAIPHPTPQSTEDKLLTPLTNFFDSILHIKVR